MTTALTEAVDLQVALGATLESQNDQQAVLHHRGRSWYPGFTRPQPFDYRERLSLDSDGNVVAERL